MRSVWLMLLFVALSGCRTFQYGAVTVADDLSFHTEHHLLPPPDVWLPAIPGDSHGAYFQQLVNISPLPILMGFPTKDMESLWGLTNGKFIWINKSLSPNGRVATLAHELGHYMQPDNLNPKEGDIFAETVSLLYCRHIGLNISLSSYTYLNIVSPNSAYFILKHQKEIDEAVAQLVTGTGG